MDIRENLKKFYACESAYTKFKEENGDPSNMPDQTYVRYCQIESELNQVSQLLIASLRTLYSEWLPTHMGSTRNGIDSWFKLMATVPLDSETYRIRKEGDTYKFTTEAGTFDLTQVIGEAVGRFYSDEENASLTNILNRNLTSEERDQIFTDYFMHIPKKRDSIETVKFSVPPLWQKIGIKEALNKIAYAVVWNACFAHIKNEVGALPDLNSILPEKFEKFFRGLLNATPDSATSFERKRIETLLNIRNVYLDIFINGTLVDLDTFGGKIAAISILLNTCHNHGTMGKHLGITREFLSSLSNLGDKQPVAPDGRELRDIEQNFPGMGTK